MMVADHVFDQGGRAIDPVWRCLVCGEIVDPIILINRINHPQPKKGFSPSPLMLARIDHRRHERI
jgi:hypothetical protein